MGRSALPALVAAALALGGVSACHGPDSVTCGAPAVAPGSSRPSFDSAPDPSLAAGAPWYMTLFGRDSILTAWMTLIADRSLARGVLETLARLQGDDVVDRTDEEPGKILHEVRLDLADGMSLAAGDVYYGSIDATPLFVMLLAEARRWGLDDDALRKLLPHADRALEAALEMLG